MAAEGESAEVATALNLQASADASSNAPTNLQDTANASADHADGPGPSLGTENVNVNEPALSKNKQKRLARAERALAVKAERRAAERARKKVNRAEKRRLVEEEGADPVQLGLVKKKVKMANKTPFGATVVVDLSFDDKMNEKEIKSMVIQLAHVYNVNRNAQCPVPILCTPLNGQLDARMQLSNGGCHLKWTGVTFAHSRLEELWDTTALRQTDNAAHNAADGATVVSQKVIGKRKAIDKSSVVYLTADSPNVLSELSEDCTYILGGIVDKNRYKNLCLDVANQAGVKHAALPISDYIELASRKVLTVNQCFEVMSKWLTLRDWEKAFYEVIPKRKFSEKSKADRRKGNRERRAKAAQEAGMTLPEDDLEAEGSDEGQDDAEEGQDEGRQKALADPSTEK